jgi:flavin reductase (DIM6/NTAB) family NADH-FMN oxidoreductase RutF
MILDPTSVPRSTMYRFLIGVVVPRPIAFVSTVSAAGAFNVAPFSFFNAISSRPPLLGLSISRRGGELKDTLRNIQEVGDFVVNVVTMAMLPRVVEASGDWPREVDEFALTGLTPVRSDLVKSPRVGESPVQLECRLHRVIELGDSSFTVGEVLRVHVADEILTDGLVDAAKLGPVGRLGGDAYSPVREIVRHARPVVKRPGGPQGGS